MAINAARQKARFEKMQTSFKGGDFAQLQDGKNVIRIFTFDHTVTKRDFDRGLYAKGTVKVGAVETEIDREVKEHMAEGEQPFHCTMKPDCPRCVAAAELNAGSKADKVVAKRMAARSRYYINAVDMAEEGTPVMKLFAVPLAVMGAVLGYINNDDFDPSELFGPNGRDWVITRDSKQNPSKMYQVQLRDKNKSEELPESLASAVQDIYEMQYLDVGADGFDPAALEDENPDTKEEPKKEETKPKAKKEEPTFEDKPSKTSTTSDIGKDVWFKDGDKTIKGKVLAINGKAYTVDTETEEWEMEKADLMFEEPATKVKKTLKK